MALVNVLAVRLEAVTAAFQSGIKAANSALDQMKGAFARASSGLQSFLERNNTLGKALGNLKNAIAGVHPAAALGVAAVAGLGLAMRNAVRESVALANELLVVSKRTGVSVEALSELRFAAEQNEVEFSSLALGLRFLQRNQVAAINGSKEAIKAFQRLGITVQELKASKTEEVLELVADGLAETGDAAQRTAKAFAVMGRGSGPALVPLLGQGSEAIRKYREEARQFGAQISTTFAHQADDYEDNLAKLKTLQRAFSIQIAQVVVPAINQFVVALFPLVKDLLPAFASTLRVTVFSLSKLGLLAKFVGVGLLQMGAALNGNIKEFNRLGAIIFEIDNQLIESKSAFEARTQAMLDAVPATQALAEETEDLAAAIDDSLAAQRKALAERQGLEGVPGGAPGIAFARREFRPAPEIGEALEAVPLDLQSEFEKANEGVLRSWEETFQSMTDIAGEAFQGFATLADSFAEALTSGADIAKVRFGDFFKKLLRDLAKAIVRALILKAIVGFFGGLGLGGLLEKIGSFLGAEFKTQGQEGPFEGGVLGSTAIARRALVSGAAPAVGAGGTMFRPTVVVNEATPRTWIEITDRHVVPRLRSRLRTMGESDFTRGG